jgi:hypothetical protein
MEATIEGWSKTTNIQASQNSREALRKGRLVLNKERK